MIISISSVLILLVTLTVILLVCFLFTWLAKKTNIPSVVALILAGLLLGSPFFKDLILYKYLNVVSTLGEIGFVVLMFLAGMEVSWQMLYKEKENSLFIAFFAALTPLMLGTAVFLLFGFSLLTSITIGITMSITAEATKARVLLDLKKLKTKLGSLMMGAGIIDDIFGIFLFALITLIFTRTFLTNESLLIVIAIIAFFMGIATHKYIGRETPKIKKIEKFLLVFIVPFFFLAMGMKFDFQSLILTPYLLTIIILLAIIGKILGVMLTYPMTKLRFKQLYLIGWGMNSRGAVELAIAFVAFNAGFLTESIYSSIIVMALITTLIFPFIITRMIKKEPKIMN